MEVEAAPEVLPQPESTEAAPPVPKPEETKVIAAEEAKAITTEEAAATAQEEASASEEIVEAPVQKNRKRCFTCNKKVGYTGLECKCKLVFCSNHRYPDQHGCTFDFKTSDRANLKKLVQGGGEFSKVERL
ncbi:unnamed protein product [Chrysoparadoxa australica]